MIFKILFLFVVVVFVLERKGITAVKVFHV